MSQILKNINAYFEVFSFLQYPSLSCVSTGLHQAAIRNQHQPSEEVVRLPDGGDGVPALVVDAADEQCDDVVRHVLGRQVYTGQLRAI